ncbi:MAG TPA: M23 family metallopeptidase [Cellvibrio sp.]|nr:M23 family metallopeptidase [Cellvibrio sp.]
MKIIIVNAKHGQTRSLSLGGWTRAFLSVCLLGIPAAVGAWGYSWLVNIEKNVLNSDAPGTSLAEQREKQEQSRQQAESQLAALTAKVAELQTRLVRLDAVGERLTKVAKLDKGEFDFSQPPGVGGPPASSQIAPAAGQANAVKADEFFTVLNELSQHIQNREQQFKTLDSILLTRSFDAEALFDSLPVENGFMSSTFGYRSDPFNGKSEFHSGIDFTAPMGTPVVAVAAGVVTLSAPSKDYGNMVEINHGSSFESRYAHNKQNLVSVGDVVKKGQVIAYVGSTGRSTAPHVHFEVYKNGRVVDPATYLQITNR